MEDIYLKFAGYEYPNPENPNKNKYLKLSLYYDIGNTYTWTGEQNNRGYYACASTVTLENRGEHVMESCEVFGKGNGKVLLKAVSRKSAKTEKQLADGFKTNKTVRWLVDKMAEQTGEVAIWD